MRELFNELDKQLVRAHYEALGFVVDARKANDLVAVGVFAHAIRELMSSLYNLLYACQFVGENCSLVQLSSTVVFKALDCPTNQDILQQLRELQAEVLKAISELEPVDE